MPDAGLGEPVFRKNDNPPGMSQIGLTGLPDSPPCPRTERI